LQQTLHKAGGDLFSRTDEIGESSTTFAWITNCEIDYISVTQRWTGVCSFHVDFLQKCICRMSVWWPYKLLLRLFPE